MFEATIKKNKRRRNPFPSVTMDFFTQRVGRVNEGVDMLAKTGATGTRTNDIGAQYLLEEQAGRDSIASNTRGQRNIQNGSQSTQSHPHYYQELSAHLSHANTRQYTCMNLGIDGDLHNNSRLNGDARNLFHDVG